MRREQEERNRIAREEAARAAAEKERQRKLEEQKKLEIEAKRKKLEELQKLKQAQQIKQAQQTKVQTANSTKQSATEKSVEYYTSLDNESLLAEVKNFAYKRGIANQLIDKKLLESTFGKNNISKLILKSYLISIGKGVTFGNG